MIDSLFLVNIFLLLKRHFKKHILSKIALANRQQCVLFPLCGKTVDMKAVLDARHQVIGVECVSLGVEAFFEENNIKHDIENDQANQCEIYKVLTKFGFQLFFFLFLHRALTIRSLYFALISLSLVSKCRF